MGLGEYGPNSFSISVPIPTDERGLVGRRCPACLRFFKLRPGTGLPTETCHCPYCGHAADISEFTTPEQEEYVHSVGMREAQERILKPMMRQFGESLKGIQRATSRGPIQIRVEVRDQWRSIPLALYREREVETDVTCQECGLEFAVYGMFATCPDCTGMNASAVFRKSMEAARRLLILLDGGLDSEMAEALLSDALRSAVGAFDAVGKELCRRFSGLLPSTPRNLFQNIEALSTALGKATGRSLAEALGEEEYTGLVRMFQVRHVYEHNLGVVDAEAIKRVPGLATWQGRKYVLARNEVQAFLRSLGETYNVVVRLLIAASSARGAP
jgi:Zn ribbon nucleic-acid-binding protein